MCLGSLLRSVIFLLQNSMKLVNGRCSGLGRCLQSHCFPSSLECLLLAPFGNETCSCYFVAYVKFVDGFWGIVCPHPTDRGSHPVFHKMKFLLIMTSLNILGSLNCPPCSSHGDSVRDEKCPGWVLPPEFSCLHAATCLGHLCSWGTEAQPSS